MATTQREPGLFSALLKYWRGARGLSQLDLATCADVSPRHVSFLETGRAKPSEDMALHLANVLAIPLREQNALLQAAGFEPPWDQPDPREGLPREARLALDRMLAQQEPYPLIVMNRRYDVLRSNRGADRVFGHFVKDPRALAPPVNGYRVLFDPDGVRPFIVDWERAAIALISRLHRETLTPPRDESLSELLAELLAFPGVPSGWRRPDFSVPLEPAFTLHLRRDDLEVRFLTTLTVFGTPTSVTLEELRIESYFPLDEATERVCRDLTVRLK